MRSLNDVQAALGILRVLIAKGDVSLEDKLSVIDEKLEEIGYVVSDLLLSRQTVDHVVVKDDFETAGIDLAEVAEQFYTLLKEQSFNNLYAFYDEEGMHDISHPGMRQACASALIRLSRENKREPRMLWVSISGGNDE